MKDVSTTYQTDHQVSTDNILPKPKSELFKPASSLGKDMLHSQSQQLINIAASDIIPNRYQPRKNFDYPSLVRLADSIKRYGILQPITVRKSANFDGKYEIICGERRYRAGIIAGITIFKCYVMTADDLASAELSVIENLLRDELNIFEQAEAFTLLITTFNMTQENVANRVSLSQSAIANKLRLLRFTQDERSKILEYSLTERHARALLRILDPSIRLRFIELIHSDHLNVASTEQLITQYIQYVNEQPASAVNPVLSSDEKQKKKEKPRGIIRNVKVFTNSIKKAADILRKTGIVVETTKKDELDAYVYTIRVSKTTAKNDQNSAVN